jgi:hypothetical protein
MKAIPAPGLWVAAPRFQFSGSVFQAPATVQPQENGEFRHIPRPVQIIL